MKIYINDWNDFKFVLRLVNKFIYAILIGNKEARDDYWSWIRLHLTTGHRRMS